jgi:hypothetical protein
VSSEEHQRVKALTVESITRTVTFFVSLDEVLVQEQFMDQPMNLASTLKKTKFTFMTFMPLYSTSWALITKSLFIVTVAETLG